MTAEKVILKGPDIDRILTRITLEILEKHREAENLVLIGIRTGGVFLADRIKAEILTDPGGRCPFYRPHS